MNNIASNPQSRSTPRAPTTISPLLTLPLEIRNLIYTHLLTAKTTSSSTTPVSKSFQPDLEIASTRLKFYKHTLPKAFLFTCHQIHNEFFTLLSAQIHFVQLTGDFVLGLSPTIKIFDILEQRPWIAKNVKCITVVLKAAGLIPLCGGVTAVSKGVTDEHPWLEKRIQLAGLKVKRFETESGLVEAVKSPSWLSSMMGNMGLEKMSDLGTALECAPWPTSKRTSSAEYNTLPALASLLVTFPNLQKIYIESSNQALISLFPSPRVTASAFVEVEERGVEVRVLLKSWQVENFRNMLIRNGVGKGEINFKDVVNGVEVDVDFERIGAKGYFWRSGFARYQLLDCLKERDI